MLPLRSQFYFPTRDSIESNSSVKLQLNRITLFQNSNPKENNGSIPCIDRKLLGGVLLLSDIALMETTPLAQSITHFSTNMESLLRCDFDDDRIPPINSSTVTDKITKDDEHTCCFGDSFFSTFRTNRAQIPVWSDSEDLSEIFLPTRNFQIESQSIFAIKPCAPLSSIIGSNKRVKDILSIQMNVRSSVAASDNKCTNLHQLERWGILSIDPLKTGDVVDVDYNVHRSNLIRNEFIVIPLVEAQELNVNERLLLKKTVSNKASNLFGSGHNSSHILATQLTTTQLEAHFYEDGVAGIFPMQTIKNLTLFKATSFARDLQNTFIDLCHDEVHDDTNRTVFIDPWVTSLRNIESFAERKTTFQDLDILNQNVFQLSQSGKSEGLTRLYMSSMSELLFYCPLLLRENNPSGHWTLDEKKCHLYDQILDTSKFHGKLMKLKKDKVRRMGDAGSLKDRLLSSTHAFHCIPIIPHSGNEHEDISNFQCTVECQEDASTWTWQPVLARNQSVVKIMNTLRLRSRLVCQDDDRQGISRDCNDEVYQSSTFDRLRNIPSILLKKNMVLLQNRSFAISNILEVDVTLKSDRQTQTHSNNVMFEMNPENDMIKFIRFAFLPAILQKVLPERCISDPTTKENVLNQGNRDVSKTKEINELSCQITEMKADVQTTKSLSTKEISRSYMIENTDNQEEDERGTDKTLHSEKQKGILHEDRSGRTANAPLQVLHSCSTSAAPAPFSALQTETSSSEKCPNIMSDLITQSLDLDQMVSSYLVMHGNPQALITKPVLTPTKITPSQTALRSENVSASVGRSSCIYDRAEGNRRMFCC